MFTKNSSFAWLRYLFAAGGLVAIGCTAETGDTSSPDEQNAPRPAEDDDTAKSEAALEGGTIRGRWRFNEEFGQAIFGRLGTNDGYRGSTMFADTNDPLRSDQNNPNENDLIGRSLRFRGTGDHAPPAHDFVTIPNSEELRDLLQPGNVSVVAWIRTNTAPTGTTYIVSKGIDVHPGDCSASSYSLYFEGGAVKFGVTSQMNDFRASPGKTGLADGEWHHIVGTYNGVRARLFVDGALVGGSQAYTDSPVSYVLGKGRQLYFGAYNHPTRLDCKLPYTGFIDDVRVYRGALTLNDVRQIGGFPFTTGPDADGDGVTDTSDVCPNTPMADRPISERGCGCLQIDAMAEDACKSDGSRCYRNHGAYVSCVSNKVSSLIGPEEILACAQDVKSDASSSPIGRTQYVCP